MSDSGKTPLFGAAEAYDPANIQTLLKAGADVMVRNKYDETALHVAARSGTSAQIQALLDAGADASSQSESGKTPWNSTQEDHQIKGSTAYLTLKNVHFSK